MTNKIGLLFWGAVFGFALSRSGASDYDLIYGMFTGQDLSVAYLMALAIVLGGLGMVLLQRMGNRTVSGDPIKVSQKPMNWRNAVGGAVFGIGWGISGACPGTVLAQLGEGKLLGMFTVAGLLSGTYIYALLVERWPAVRE